VSLIAEATVPDGAHAAGSRYLSPDEWLELDLEDRTMPSLSEVGFQRRPDGSSYLVLGKGASAAVLPATLTRGVTPSTVPFKLCGQAKPATTAILLRATGSLHVCVRTTRGRTALLLVRVHPGEAPELNAAYTTWD
jgi:hypothetical protein